MSSSKRKRDKMKDYLDAIETRDHDIKGLWSIIKLLVLVVGLMLWVMYYGG